MYQVIIITYSSHQVACPKRSILYDHIEIQTY
jgi:hypothetical protein